MHEPVLEHGFQYRALAFGNAHHGHDLGLHVRREPGIRQGLDGNGLEFLRSHHMDTADVFFHNGPCFPELGNERLHVFAEHIVHQDIPLGHGSRHHIGAGFDPVRDHRVFPAFHAFHSVDADGSGTGASYLASHHVDVVGQVHDFRFLGRIFNDGGAFGHGRRHHQVFRGSHTGEIQVDGGAHQTVGGKGFNVAVALFDGGPQGFEPFQMDIDGPGADGTASGLGNLGPADPCQQGSHDQERGTHGADQIIGSFPAGNVVAVDFQHMRGGMIHLQPQTFQYFADGAYILQFRNFQNCTALRPQNGCCNDGQHCIFGPADPHSSCQPMTTLYHQFLHA